MDDYSLDKIPNNENGVTIRSGFPKFPKIMNTKDDKY